MGTTQQGQRDSVAIRATLNLRRTVAIEFGTCRSGRNGGTPRAISFGNCNFFEKPRVLAVMWLEFRAAESPGN
jgi:hypothetical protein